MTLQAGAPIVVLLSGPNLDLLGDREPEIYGYQHLADHVAEAVDEGRRLGLAVEHHQSNHEGALIEEIHRARKRAAALIVNAGALSHTSWAMHDALTSFEGAVVELHLSNPAAREPYRHTSVLASAADGLISGFGGLGYRLAVIAVGRLLGLASVQGGVDARGHGSPRRRFGPTTRGLDVTAVTDSVAGGPVAGGLAAGKRASSPGESLPPADVVGRIPRLRERLAGEQLDCLLVVAMPNVRYLTGFTGSAGLVLVSNGGAMLATDGRYRTQAKEQLDAAGLGDVSLVVGRLPEQIDALVGFVRETVGESRSRVGLEAEHVVWASQRRWSERLAPSELVATSGMVEALRSVKDAGEIARIGAAAAIADAALFEVAPMLDRGTTESEFALALDVCMRRLGAEDRAFETIVASGPNSAKPHARPGDRQLTIGDPVVVDFGAMVDGYRSDMTRTFFVGGNPSDKMREIYEAVLESQRAGVAAVGPGVSGGDIDDVCRRSLAAAGFGDAFEHGTGHGVGLDIHEAPSVGPGSTGILTPGTVATVEPGAYVAGLGGVRIEDTVVVTTDGCLPLTSFTKDFVVPR